MSTSYDGGKGGAGVYQWIINQIPPHRRYTDLFLGNSAVMRYKRPAEVSFGVELSERVIAEYWRHTDRPDLIVIAIDALEALAIGNWHSDDFLYADPPYLMETRSSQQQLYQFEFAEREQHIALLRRLKELPCMVAISGYYSELYAELLAGWRTSTFQTVNRAGKPAEEWLWMNYPKPLELHDYRFLGRNFRERERIKRKKQRWTERLRRMPDLERYALMEAVGELRASLAGNDDVPGSIASGDDGAHAGATASSDDIDEGHLVASPDLAVAAGIDRSDDGIPSWPASAGLAMVDRLTLECASPELTSAAAAHIATAGDARAEEPL